MDWQCNVTLSDVYDICYITRDNINIEDIFNEDLL